MGPSVCPPPVARRIARSQPLRAEYKYCSLICFKLHVLNRTQSRIARSHSLRVPGQPAPARRRRPALRPPAPPSRRAGPSHQGT